MSDTLIIEDRDAFLEELTDIYGTPKYYGIDEPFQAPSADFAAKDYISETKRLLAFGIVEKPIPADLTDKLLQLFPDLSPQDFELYDRGLTVIFSKRDNNRARVRVVLLRREDGRVSNDTPIEEQTWTVTEDFIYILPPGVQNLTKSSRSSVSNRQYAYFGTITTDTAVSDFIAQLPDSFALVQDTKIENGRYVTFQRAGEELSLLAISQTDNSNQSQIVLRYQQKQ